MVLIISWISPVLRKPEAAYGGVHHCCQRPARRRILPSKTEGLTRRGMSGAGLQWLLVSLRRSAFRLLEPPRVTKLARALKAPPISATKHRPPDNLCGLKRGASKRWDPK